MSTLRQGAVLALILSCAGPNVMIRADHPAQAPDAAANGGRETFVDGRPAGRLRVNDGGEGGGLPVILVHGNGGRLEAWNAQLRHLRRSRRAVAFDWRGMGESAPSADGRYDPEAIAEDIAAVANALGLDRFVLAGHSFGGGAVAAFGGKYPDRVAAILFVDPAGDLRHFPPGQLSKYLELLRSDRYQEVAERNFLSALEGAPPWVVESVLATLRNTSKAAFVAAFDGLARFDPKAALERYPGPMLTVVNEKNDDEWSLHRLVPRIEMRVMRGASHWLMMERADEFNAIMDEFLARVDSGSRSSPR